MTDVESVTFSAPCPQGHPATWTSKVSGGRTSRASFSCEECDLITVHVRPEFDSIEHVTNGDDCPCAPVTEPVPLPDGAIGWVEVHNRVGEAAA